MEKQKAVKTVFRKDVLDLEKGFDSLTLIRHSEVFTDKIDPLTSDEVINAKSTLRNFIGTAMKTPFALQEMARLREVIKASELFIIKESARIKAVVGASSVAGFGSFNINNAKESCHA